MASPLCPNSVTSQIFTQKTLSSGYHAALVAGLDQRFRMLRAVVERLPQHFTPYKHLPEYRLTYYIETLSCGHQQPYFPQTGPMAKRRKCAACKQANSLPPRKPVTSSADEKESVA